MEFSGKTVVVIGGKRSGLSATELLVTRGARVRVMDAEPLSSEEQGQFHALGVPVVKQTAQNLLMQGRGPDVIVVSPGVPCELPMLIDALGRGFSSAKRSR